MLISSSVKNIFSKARLLDSGNPSVILGESELYSILLLTCDDLDWDIARIGLPNPSSTLLKDNYFEVPFEWFLSHISPPSVLALQQAVATGISIEPDFGLYFLNLASLHKRRLKFQKILSYQPKPTMDQIGPRGLLEYGLCAQGLLFNWLIWRKWIFDIDNRSGQETGYLFEPILASCLGGESVSSSNSPVKRLDDSGLPKSTGRQIDCYIGSENVAYEFKLRVTIAASGQGRFSEELSFPIECQAAGITPVLFVLDPTASNRLSELSAAFTASGGAVYLGEAAWAHLEEKSGETMARFIEKYIKPPLKAMNDFDTSSISSVRISWENNRIVIASDTEEYIIDRYAESQPLQVERVSLEH
ncbi:MAG: restriction endonuclease [Saprospiraceae bacterium]